MTERRNRGGMLLAIGGIIAVTAYAALAAAQILVLNPLAAAPGRTLGQIAQDLAAAGEQISVGFTVIVLAIGPVLGIVLALLLARRNDTTPVAIASAYLLILTFGAPAYFIASFGPGMALADTYMIGGADYSPWARPLYIVSALAAVVLLTLLIVVAARSRAQARHAAAYGGDQV